MLSNWRGRKIARYYILIKWSTSKFFLCGGTTNGKKKLVSAQQCLKVFSEVHE